MVSIKFAGLYHFTKNHEKSINFYEKLLNRKVRRGYKNRWAEFDEYGLMNIQFDFINMDSNDFQSQVSANYLELLKQEKREKRKGFIASFATDEIEAAYKHVQSIKPKFLTEIMKVNFSVPFYFFHCQDPDGNILEIFQVKSDKSKDTKLQLSQ